MAARRLLRSGSGGEWARFALLMLAFCAGLALAVADKLERVGQPDAGFMLNGIFLYPTRDDAADAGLRYGGRLLAVNGREFVPRWAWNARPEGLALEPGAVNTIRFERPDGEEREVAIAVREWRAGDALYTQGAIDVIGLLMFALGLTTFLLRPWDAQSWAVLAVSALSGGVLEALYVPGSRDAVWRAVYMTTTLGFVYVTPLHIALALPILQRRFAVDRRIAIGIYALGLALSALNLAGYLTQSATLEQINRPVGLGTFLAAIFALVGRSAWLSARAQSRLVRQRARILLAGTLLGFAPLGVVLFLQIGLGWLSLDARLAYWQLGIFFFAMARITLRSELLNARVAVRRALLYGGAVLALTAIAVWLSVLSPWAVALLLLPVLYLWPEYSARLDARLYPKRASLPGLVRATGRELAAQGEIDGVLAVLARSAERLLDCKSGVALLFGGDGEARLRVAAHGMPAPDGEPPLESLAVLGLLRASRKELARASVAVEPQFENVRGELLAELDRLGAELVVPMLDEQSRVVGALAVGPRGDGEPFADFELDVLGAIVQQAGESIERAEALARLRARERDFADLKRFFPAPVIDRVMARGGTGGLERRRKPVTVLFADLRGFTSFSDTVEPEEVTETLNEFHAAVGAHVSAREGTLERFTGDGFMVVFNDPVEQPDHMERAVRLALDMRETVARLREGWQRKGYPIDLGIGVHSGYATVGFIGYEGRRDYGVIGNVTNLAARLSDAAKGGEILISARVAGELGEALPLEPTGPLALKGFAEPQLAYRVGDPVTAPGSSRSPGTASPS